MVASSIAVVATAALTVFSGETTEGPEAIWKSNGTVTGTTEITKLFGTSNMPYGTFAQLGTKVLFEGMDSHFVNGLFVTDGTAAGTKEIVAAAGSRSQGLNPAEITTYGPTKALFNGIDSGDNYDLWVTDGTATGTRPVPGTTNIDPRYLKGYAGLIYFASITRKGLWASNGTTAHVIAGTAGLVPEQPTVFNGKLYFVDEPTRYLYTTDGTPTGTKKLIYTGASLDMTAFGKYLVFESLDSNQHLDLFVCAGTTAPAFEVSNTTGIFDNLRNPSTGDPLSPEMTVFKGNLYFEAKSVKGGFGLWQSNLSKAGTHEVTGIAGTAGAGIFPAPQDPDFNGPNFAVLGEALLFDGAVPGGFAPQWGQTYLWTSNGTATGTHALKGIKDAGYNSTLGFDASNMTTLKLPVP